MIGDASWMSRIGGVYYVIVYTAIFLFLYGLALMFGLTDSAVEPFVRLLMPWLFKEEAVL